jgi:hypothetical protein
LKRPPNPFDVNGFPKAVSNKVIPFEGEASITRYNSGTIQICK